jgi:hypothetical protein
LQQVFNQHFSKSLAQSKRSTASLIMKLRLNSYVNSYMTLVWTSQKSRYLMLMLWDLLPRNESCTWKILSISLLSSKRTASERCMELRWKLESQEQPSKHHCSMYNKESLMTHPVLQTCSKTSMLLLMRCTKT